MEKDVKQLNAWAKMSCARWNKNPLTRKINRKRYRNAAEDWCRSSEYKQLIRHRRNGDIVNTYPFPYNDPEFANWEEDDTPDGYSLISDQSGCVIRYSTSYCAWKIFETTGVWPQKTSNERLDAKRWQQFLYEAGYHQICTELRIGCNYVGIDPTYGEWGLVVWVEELQSDKVLVSSYVNKKFKVWTVDPKDYLWVQIK